MSAVATLRSKGSLWDPDQTVPPTCLSMFSYKENQLIVPASSTGLHVTGITKDRCLLPRDCAGGGGSRTWDGEP